MTKFTASSFRTRSGPRGAFIVLQTGKHKNELVSVSLPDDDRRRLVLGLLEGMPVQLRIQLAKDLLTDVEWVTVTDDRAVMSDAAPHGNGAIC